MLPPVINIFEKAVRKAGKILIRDFGEIENLQIQSKGLGDFVTNTDIRVEKILIETIKYYYPEVSFITEESGEIKGNEIKIVIDPIDGTSNFIHGIPIVGIVVARIYENEITDSVIFNPIINDFFWASKGKGAWCNNKRLRVSKRHHLSSCLIGTGIPFGKKTNERFSKQLINISSKTAGVRRLGAASIDLAYVSAGKLDGYWEEGLNLWDIASGVLMVKEAGGKVSQPSGEKWTFDSGNILASNQLIHEELQQNLTLL